MLAMLKTRAHISNRKLQIVKIPDFQGKNFNMKDAFGLSV